MSYEIESKSDLFSGVSLIVKIPEEELDQKALYTIQADKPDFILPFRSRYVDRQVEFVYQVGTNSKLQYLSGERLPKEYADMWTHVLKPIVDCGDWFMNPYSFVLSVEHLYYDKNNKAVSYIYIPSVQGCSGYAQLKEMAADLSKLISASDADLENKVLRAIMKDFNPTEFLQILKSYSAVKASAMISWPVPAMANGLHPSAYTVANDQCLPPPSAYPCVMPIQAPEQKSAGEYRTMAPSAAQAGAYSLQPQLPESVNSGNASYESVAHDPGDIVINIPEKGKPARKSKEKAEKKGNKNQKKEKENSKSKKTRDLPDRKKGNKQEIMSNSISTVQQRCDPAANNIHVCAPINDPIDVTQCISTELSGARLRLVGSATVQQVINVRISAGEFFTVGRFDAALGRKQSSFEFDKKTKAISRRHAVIERHADGYRIIDLASSAGTFLDGDKLPPNAPCALSHGSRLSFGNAGADYIWECE